MGKVTQQRHTCGRPARRSPSARAGFVLLGLLLLSGGGGCGRQRARVPTPPPKTVPAGPVLLQDVSASVGFRFQHDSASMGEFFMPEHIAGGAAFLDYDNDGRLDIYCVQAGGPKSKARNQLFHQQPDGRFLDVSEGSGLDLAGFGMGATVGDVDNDGLPDVFVTEYGAVRLCLNRGGGKFVEAAAAAGIDNARWATAASFLDYDRDGWLDLVVANYVDYLPELKCYDAAGALDFCGPQNFQGTVTRLFHNLGRTGAGGQVRFEDVTVRSGLARALGKALGVLCADFDGDRWPDIFIADDGIANRLYVNQRNGTFLEEAATRGIAYNAMGATAGNMGVALGDVNGDGLFDLMITHLSYEQHALWVQGPRGLFEDKTARCGLIDPLWRGTAFGAVLGDLDLDGWPDLAYVSGSIRRGLAHDGPRLAGLSAFWSPYAQHYQLFLNDAKGGFVEVSQANPAFCGFAAIGRGLACGDFDNDGALDLLAICAGGPAQLFRNVAPRRGHWLAVRALEPTAHDRDAIGAEVLVESGQRRWWGLVQPSYSYLVSNDPRVHLGLGAVASIDAIRVLWPDGSEEVFPGGPADRQVTLRHGSGRKP